MPVKQSSKPKPEIERPQAPALFPPEDNPNKAGLADIWLPLNTVLGEATNPINGHSVAYEFLFQYSDLEGKKKIAHYQRGEGGDFLAADEDGTCYEEDQETGRYKPITREAALAKWPDLLAASVLAQQESKIESPLDIAARQIVAVPQESQEIESADAEFSNEQALALRDASLGGTVDKLSMLHQHGQQILDARIDILRRLRKASIMLTFPTDYVLFRNKDTGQEMAYLQDCGCERIQGLWGIEITDISPFERIEGDNNAFAYIIRGSGRSRFLGGDGVQDVEGVRYSDDPFFRKTTGMRLMYYVRKSARTNLDGNILRTLAGLSNIPIEELKACGIDTDKCHKGRGYESAGERAGADVVIKEAGIPASQYPKCDKCGGEMKFIPGKDSGDKKYDAFFACKKPQGTCDGKTVKAAGWIAKVKQAQPKAETDTQPQNDSGWKCGKAKQGTIESMRKLLTSKHGWTAQELYVNLFELFPEDGITVESLGDERAARYIAHLSKAINSQVTK